MTSKLSLAMAASRLLTEARDFIKDREHWGRGTLYEGLSTPEARTSLAGASRVCAIGGVMKAANLGVDTYQNISPKNHAEAFEALRVLAGTIQGDMDNESRQRYHFHQWGRDIHEFNDQIAGHEEIVSAFDRAIEHQCSVVREMVLQTDQTELLLDGQKDNAS